MWQEKEAKQTLFNRDRVPAEVLELIIVEGELDCMTLVQLGYQNVVSVPGGASNLDWIESDFDWLSRFDTLFLCLDADDAGEKGARKIAKRLGSWRCRRMRLPFKDANECLQRGMTKEHFDEFILQADDMAPATVRMAESFFQEMLEDDREGAETGFKRFDFILGGLRPGEVTVWTGRNGDGKTTFLNQLVLNLLTRHVDQRVCLASLEMRPKRLLTWMCRQAGIIACLEGLQEFTKITAGKLSLVNAQHELAPDDLLEAFEYVARRFGTQTFVVDSLLRVDLGSGPDWLESQKRFMNRLTQFALTHEVHVLLVAHPRKGSTDQARIDKVDIAGSGDISNLAFNVISLRRLKGENGDPDAILEVMKNRETGKLGAVSLKFDEESKRFKEV